MTEDHGCYICQPDNPHADPEGCLACDIDYWLSVLNREGRR